MIVTSHVRPVEHDRAHADEDLVLDDAPVQVALWPIVTSEPSDSGTPGLRPGRSRPVCCCARR